MTSKPASRAATAIISEPLECPSSPGLPTTIRGRPPCRAPQAATRARTASARGVSRPSRCPSTPVAARYSPKMARSASAHSPVVTRARAHAIEAGMRFVPAAAASRSARTVRSTSAWLRRVFVARSMSSVSAAETGSNLKRPPSSPETSGDARPSVQRLRPTTTISPLLMRARRSAWLRTSAAFMYPDSTAASAPPACSMRAISA